jgi:type IV secretory pathway VirB2 component (pilin)
MDLSHFSLPGWFVWLAAALGVITALITIFNSVRIYNRSETFDSVFESIGEIIQGAFAVILPILGILAVVGVCAFCGNFAYSAYHDYVSKPQVNFDNSEFGCQSQYSHLYLKIQNTTDTAWQYAITIDDKDPAGYPWGDIPQYATGLLELNDALTIETHPGALLCQDMANYTQLELGATASGAKPRQVTAHPTVKITPSPY